MEPFSFASAAYVVASALVSVRLFCKNLGNLQKFFGQMVYRPPLAKISLYAYEYKLNAQNKNVNKNNRGVTRYYENMSHI